MNKVKIKNITLCTIVADCEDCLPRFFSWCLPLFENIVVVTSESRDNTIQIVQKISTDNQNIVHEHRNIDSFSKQKQFSIDLAQTEWKIVIDADEILEELDLDAYVEKLAAGNIDLIRFPRYNLQTDGYHYLKSKYPDYQSRLFNSRVKFDLSIPIHEGVVGGRKRGTSSKHIIHWGHIRPEQQLQRKSDVRKRFAHCDQVDGAGLLQSGNWFHERNTDWDKRARRLPKRIIKRVKEYEDCCCDGL